MLFCLTFTTQELPWYTFRLGEFASPGQFINIPILSGLQHMTNKATDNGHLVTTAGKALAREL